jgi:hypothetical protein
VGVVWKPKGLNHSYISYRLAQVQDAWQVGSEVAQSPHTINVEFNGLATLEDAESWFGLVPSHAHSNQE